MDKMQTEHREWLAKMYPDQPLWIPAAGMIEEAGELMHACLKREQADMWGEEGRYAGVDWTAEISDAIGDCAIYCCSLCNALNLDFPAVFRGADRFPQKSGSTFSACLHVVEAACEAGRLSSTLCLATYIATLKHVA